MLGLVMPVISSRQGSKRRMAEKRTYIIDILFFLRAYMTFKDISNLKTPEFLQNPRKKRTLYGQSNFYRGAHCP